MAGTPPSIGTYREIDLLDPSMTRLQAYHLLNSVIVPRPIAWVSTISPDGIANVAPHSFSNIASVDPPMVMFVSLGEKDTVRNARATGCFVVNVASHAMVEAMNESSIDAPANVSEFELAGLEPIESSVVAAPRVAGAPVSLECELDRVIELGNDPACLAIGRVVRAHVDQRVFDGRDRIDPAALDAVARMGGNLYATTRDRFALDRPTWREHVAGAPLHPNTER